MKKVVLSIEDSVFEKFLFIVDICNGVELLKLGNGDDILRSSDHCFASAIMEMRQRKDIKTPADYAYIMQVTLEGKITQDVPFVTADEFITYLNIIGIVDGVPGRTTLYDAINRIRGSYPDWTFTDNPKPVEVLRRRNIARLFLSAFFRHQRRLSDGISDK